MKQLKYLSLKTIAEQLNITIDKAREVKQIVTGKKNPHDYTNVKAWINSCLNMPSKGELKLEALNEILEGYGTEPITSENIHVDNYYYNIVACYVNLGETYINTVLRDNRTAKYYLMSWGDFVENNNI